MDSSELTKSRRDRVISNSFSSNGISSRHLVPKITFSNLLSFKYGSKLLKFNKKTVLPNCGGTNGKGCNQDILDNGILEPLNDCSSILSINYINSNTPGIPDFEPSGEFSCIEFPTYTFSVIFGPETPTNGTFSITAEPLPGNPPLPPLPYVNPVTVDPVTGLLTVPGAATDPTEALWTITYTTNCGQTQWSQRIGFC
jgi:hypothetical protein